MPTISALYTYPIKSCGALSHERIALTETGLAYDRHWMLTDEDGTFLSQREHAKMALIQPRLLPDALEVSAPNMPPLYVPLQSAPRPPRPVSVWRDTVLGVDEGDDAAAWLQEALQFSARLVHMPPQTYRRVNPERVPQSAQVGFADGYPLLIAGEASLEDLNARLVSRGKAPVPMARFRANVIVRDAAPFAEDDWAHFEMAGIAFEGIKPCARCVVTTIDPATATQPDAQEPLATLATFRRHANGGVMFGHNVVHRGTGMLAVGNAVHVKDAPPHQ